MHNITKYLTNDNEDINQSTSCFISFYCILMQVYYEVKQLKVQSPALADPLQGPGSAQRCIHKVICLVKSEKILLYFFLKKVSFKFYDISGSIKSISTPRNASIFCLQYKQMFEFRRSFIKPVWIVLGRVILFVYFLATIINDL